MSVIAEHAWDLAALSKARMEGRLEEALAAGAGPRDRPRDEARGDTWGPRRTQSGHPLLAGTVSPKSGRPVRKLWHSSGGSAGW